MAAAAATPGKCFLVTGPPGVGKTTLIERVVERLTASFPSLKIQGFYTREIRRDGGERMGFQVIALDGGRSAPLASSSSISTSTRRGDGEWPRVGKYRVDVPSFESLALPQLQVKEGTDLFVIDEVGKMELFSPSFFPAVLKLLESNIPVLASIPVPKFGRDIPQVSRLRNHPGATIFTLSPNNRDAIKEQVYSLLVDSLIKN